MIIYGEDYGKSDHYLGLSYRCGQNRHYLWVNTTNGETHTEICDVAKEWREILIENFYDTRSLKGAE